MAKQLMQQILEGADVRTVISRAVTEGEHFKGYDIQWVTDPNKGKHVIVTRNGNFVSTYDNADQAKKEINTGEIEDFDSAVNEEV